MAKKWFCDECGKELNNENRFYSTSFEISFKVAQDAEIAIDLRTENDLCKSCVATHVVKAIWAGAVISPPVAERLK